jgi:tRNA A37 threonylcarbamoyladenosine dehydratase
VVNNLARSGYGDWTIVDHDHMLPHNLVRHQLDSQALGLSKARALAAYGTCQHE